MLPTPFILMITPMVFSLTRKLPISKFTQST
nr:MAG TPA: hypothetical protein [Caudoviricetes sp.]